MTETPTNVTTPPDLTYGYVDGRIILAIGDRSDAGRMPDPVPAHGMTVTFTPANTILKVTTPTPATVIKQPIVCAVDADGYLIDGQAGRGVWLVTGTYKVTYSHPRAMIPSHDVEVTTGHTEAAPLDLTTAMPPGGPVLAPSEYAELNGRLTILEAGGGVGGGSLTYVTANTDIPDGTVQGQLVGYRNKSATAITIEGVNVGAGALAIFEWSGSAWTCLVPVTPVTPDTTSPTAGTLSVSMTSTEANLSVTGALDDVALNATPYAFSKDAGTTWTAWQEAATYKFTGLASSTSFTFQHKVRDAAGNVTLGATITVTTEVAPPTAGAYGPAVLANNPLHYWSFGEASGNPVDQGSSPSALTLTNLSLGAAGIGDEPTCVAATVAGASATYTGPNLGAGGNTFAVEGIISWQVNGVYGFEIWSGVNGWFIIQLDYAPGGAPRVLSFTWKQTNGTSYTLTTGATTIAAGVPTHFACVQTGTTQKILLNGSVVATGTTAGVAASPGAGTQTLLSQWGGKAAGIAAYSGTIPSDADFLAHAEAAGLA